MNHLHALSFVFFTYIQRFGLYSVITLSLSHLLSRISAQVRHILFMFLLHMLFPCLKPHHCTLPPCHHMLNIPSLTPAVPPVPPYLSERLPPSRLYHSLIHLSACLIYVCLHARAKETSWKGTGKTVHTYVFSFLVLFLGSAVEMPKGSKFKQGSFHKVGRLFASTLHP